MKKLLVNTSRNYEVVIQPGSISNVANFLHPQFLKSHSNAVIITDSNVSPLYASLVKESFLSAGLNVFIFDFKAGEAQKNLSTIYDIYHFLAENQISRQDFIAALGGGVVGDIAGFAAATYLRGIPFIQLPTSLLAQIDSSVGGKTGVDIPQGKNLVGAFWQPSYVIIDPHTLHSLPPEYFADGLAEAIKYGCIKDKNLFNRLLYENAHDFIDDLIYTCVKIKSEVVQKDEFESGNRIILNFGHTFGHAIEKLHGFSGISHGQAVGIGMVIAAKSGQSHGLSAPGTSDLISKVLRKYNLPINTNFSIADITNASLSDKKSTGDCIKLVLLKDIGNAFVHKIKKSELADFIKTSTD